MSFALPAVFASVDALEARVGHEVFVSDWLILAQDRVNQFADATGDHQWLHVDVERAERESPFGGPIAHGFLVLSLLAKFAAASVTVQGVRSAVNYGLDKVRFVSPVKVGARIRGRGTLTKFSRIADGAQIHWMLTVEIEGQDRPACIAETIGRYFA